MLPQPGGDALGKEADNADTNTVVETWPTTAATTTTTITTKYRNTAATTTLIIVQQTHAYKTHPVSPEHNHGDHASSMTTFIHHNFNLVAMFSRGIGTHTGNHTVTSAQ